MLQSISSIKTREWRKIHDTIVEKYGFFIAKCDMQENPHNLEPVLAYKHEGKTTFTVERRV